MTTPVRSTVTFDFADQVAVVTGASRGIGRAIALQLGAAGAEVYCVGRDTGRLAETAGAIRQAGGKAHELAADIAQAADVTRLIDTVTSAERGLHILVNNAGITRDTLIPRMSDEQWDEVLATNLRGAFLCTRAVTRPMMQQRYGRIINISSVSGLMGNPGQANYAASKAGLIGMSKAVSKELASRNVTVNVVAPGFIESEMTEALGPAVVEEVKKRVPVKRLGTPDEVATGVLFLASRAASYITGQVLVIDGGMIG